jgi:hypothetical protein
MVASIGLRQRLHGVVDVDLTVKTDTGKSLKGAVPGTLGLRLISGPVFNTL